MCGERKLKRSIFVANHLRFRIIDSSIHFVVMFFDPEFTATSLLIYIIRMLCSTFYASIPYETAILFTCATGTTYHHITKWIGGAHCEVI